MGGIEWAWPVTVDSRGRLAGAPVRVSYGLSIGPANAADSPAASRITRAQPRACTLKSANRPDPVRPSREQDHRGSAGWVRFLRDPTRRRSPGWVRFAASAHDGIRRHSSPASRAGAVSGRTAASASPAGPPSASTVPAGSGSGQGCTRSPRWGGCRVLCEHREHAEAGASVLAEHLTSRSRRLLVPPCRDAVGRRIAARRRPPRRGGASPGWRAPGAACGRNRAGTAASAHPPPSCPPPAGPAAPPGPPPRAARDPPAAAPAAPSPPHQPQQRRPPAGRVLGQVLLELLQQPTPDLGDQLRVPVGRDRLEHALPLQDVPRPAAAARGVARPRSARWSASRGPARAARRAGPTGPAATGSRRRWPPAAGRCAAGRPGRARTGRAGPRDRKGNRLLPASCLALRASVSSQWPMAATSSCVSVPAAASAARRAAATRAASARSARPIFHMARAACSARASLDGVAGLEGLDEVVDLRRNAASSSPGRTGNLRGHAVLEGIHARFGTSPPGTEAPLLRPFWRLISARSGRGRAGGHRRLSSHRGCRASSLGSGPLHRGPFLLDYTGPPRR